MLAEGLAAQAHDLVANPQAPAIALLERLDTIDPDHKLGDPSYRVDLLQLATPEEAVDALQQVNTVLYGADNPSFHTLVNLGHGEGMNRQVGYIGLHPEKGREVFDYAFRTAQNLVHAEGPDALGRAGVIIGGTIVGTQMFTDGNKRTARAGYLIIAEGNDGSEAAAARYAEVLGHTHEARSSIFFQPNSLAARRAFAYEGLEPEQARSAIRFGYAWESFQPSRRELDELLAPSIDDVALRKTCIDVLQQVTFGADAITGIIGRTPEIQEPITRDTTEAAIAQAKMAVALITPETAAAIIARDAQRKKEFMIRIIDSTAGVRPLHFISDRGETSDTVVDFVTG